MKTGIFYGSTYGNTQEAGEQLVALLGNTLGEKPEIFDVHSTKIEKLLDFDLILVGCSTWNVGEVQDDWDDKLDHLDDLDLSGKFVALFGAGDQFGYSDSFADSLGILAEKLAERGAILIGKWPTESYEFDFSRADLGDGFFVGLPLDYDNQGELTTPRLTQWSAQIAAEVTSLASP
ncbi:flavodoxin [Abditibacteriota bacterium]|nr:flavodoxin [Abditibacteriota bacterium]